MKKIIQNYLLAIILIFSSFGTNAVLLTETYESTVLETYNSPFQIGDTFSWTVSFDNESQRTVTYGDGQNKIAEFGQGDDYVYSAFCTDSYFTSPNAEWCPNGGSSNWDYLADAVFDLSEFYLPHEEAGLTGITSYLNYRHL